MRTQEEIPHFIREALVMSILITIERPVAMLLFYILRILQLECLGIEYLRIRKPFT